MLSKRIYFKNFKKKKISSKITYYLNKIFDDKNQILTSLSKSYKNSYKKSELLKFKKFKNITLIGMGGSSLGARCIYNFLSHKIKKKITFIDNLNERTEIQSNRDNLNLIISKSGNTLETIANSNILIKKSHKNIFITEKKDSYLMNLAKNLKSEIILHNNFIGGRYSVLSEVGMLPAELMGLEAKKFRGLNDIIKNKRFINSLVLNVSNKLDLINKKKFNSIILNYDEKSNELFSWYQQLIAESLGKKGKGILPIISTMPKDNHSLMQLYLDGPKNNFFTFYFAQEKNSKKIDYSKLHKSHYYLKNKSLNNIKFAQFLATQEVFKKKNIPFRSFVIKKRDEKTLSELFIFFILETILLGKALNINPYDQPAVELIKVKTKKFLVNS